MPAVIGMAVVDDRPAKNIDDGLAVLVVDGLSRVAEVPIQPPVRAEDEFVGRVIVLRLARLGEKQFLLVRLPVAIRVGEDENVRRRGDNHAVAQDADTHRRIDIASLVEHGRFVGSAVAVGVFENQNAIAGRPLAGSMPVIHDLANPDAAAIVDIDIRRAGEHRLRSEQRRFQTRCHIETGHGLRGRVIVLGSTAAGVETRTVIAE